MKPVHLEPAKLPVKAPTCIAGFDEITGGGLPRGRATLLAGGPGSGKTIFALQFLARGARADLVQSGDFDISGVLAVLQAQSRHMGARRIVFDALDVVLPLLPDREAKRREVYRLHQWLLASDMTAIITAKSGGDQSGTSSQTPFGFLRFLVDCAVILNHGVMWGASQRSLRACCVCAIATRCTADCSANRRRAQCLKPASWPRPSRCK